MLLKVSVFMTLFLFNSISLSEVVTSDLPVLRPFTVSYSILANQLVTFQL